MLAQHYLPVLRKRWPLILAVVVVAVVASYLFVRLQTPTYRATAFLTVTASRIGDYSQALAIEKNIRQYARALQTETLAERVNDVLKLDLPADGLRAKMRASPIMDDLTLQLEVDDSDPNRARDVVFAWAKEYITVQQNQMAAVDPRDRIEVALLDRPAPAVLNWPKRNQILIAAALLGLLVGTLLAFLLDYADDTLKSPQDVDRYVRAPLLAAIPALEELPRANGQSRRQRSPPLTGRIPSGRARETTSATSPQWARISFPALLTRLARTSITTARSGLRTRLTAPRLATAPSTASAETIGIRMTSGTSPGGHGRPTRSPRYAAFMATWHGSGSK